MEPRFIAVRPQKRDVDFQVVFALVWLGDRYRMNMASP
jgi:hypothetical protein